MAICKKNKTNRRSIELTAAVLLLLLVLSACGTKRLVSQTEGSTPGDCACERFQKQAEKEYRELEHKKQAAAASLGAKKQGAKAIRPVRWNKRPKHIARKPHAATPLKGWRAAIKNKLVRCPKF